MPRLTNQLYFLQSQHLRSVWLKQTKSAMPLLKANEQWALFAFFLPHERISDQLRLEFREYVTKQEPSLPQRAGRAFAKLRLVEQRLEAYRMAPKPVPKKKNAPYELHVLSEVHPEIDIDKLVKILLHYESRE